MTLVFEDLLAPSVASGIIQGARIEASLSLSELAERAGTSKQTLSEYERGVREPRLSTLARIVEAAGFELRVTYTEPDAQADLSRRQTEQLPRESRRRWERAMRRRVEANRVRLSGWNH